MSEGQKKKLTLKEFRDRKRAASTVSVGVSAFPIKQWAEWNKDCQESFGDSRWFKMWNDHLIARQFQELRGEIAKLELKIVSLEGKEKDEKIVVKTMKKSFDNVE